MSLFVRKHTRGQEAFKESEVTRIHGLAFVNKGNANAKD
jgi:UDP-N-acetylenolpyruvoylglucosamine reductase